MNLARGIVLHENAFRKTPVGGIVILEGPPAYCRPDAYAAFQKAVRRIDSEEGLLRAAFAISLHDRPQDDFLVAEATIGQLARTVKQRVSSDAPQAIQAHLHDVLFDVVGFSGNVEDYYDPANSYVGEVLRLRRGIPISLVLVYKAVARELGIAVHGINAPGHFLAGVELPEYGQPASQGLSYVDPFYGGALLNEREVFDRIEQVTGRNVQLAEPVLTKATHREWLGRMLNNLQAVFASKGRERDLYAMQELQQLLG
ncbi:MAG: transglutaminase-like domain-containing protein, partial [Pirellulales bacterium]|nr:transglutaminase-like domain-containing protein [Pirellulales bacterium]